MNSVLKPVDYKRLTFNNNYVQFIKASDGKTYLRYTDIPVAINLTPAGLYLYIESHDSISGPDKIFMPTQQIEVSYMEYDNVIKMLKYRLGGQVTNPRKKDSHDFLNWLQKQDLFSEDKKNMSMSVDDYDSLKGRDEDVVSVSTKKLDEPVCVSVQDDVICSRNAQNDESKKLAINISVLGKSILKLGLEW